MDEGIVVKRVRTGEPLSFFKAAAFLGIEPRTLSALLINDEITPNFGCKSGSKFYEVKRKGLASNSRPFFFS